jgi:8-oxo-dGTP pyrophosphatase MutT (NUDIX family)
MTKDKFLSVFQLCHLRPATQNYHYPKDKNTKKEAAALISLIEEYIKGERHLSVLLTKRAAHLRHHGGQISFPGGKVEDYDEGIIDTALRENEEEIGLQRSSIDVIGQLKQYQTISGFIITPIVAFINNNHTHLSTSEFTKSLNNTLDKNEVEEVFIVPLAHFLQKENRHSVTVSLHNQPHQVHFIPYKHYNIWGATAAMLKDLAAHLTG